MSVSLSQFLIEIINLSTAPFFGRIEGWLGLKSPMFHSLKGLKYSIRLNFILCVKERLETHG
jgi:hypothetical protein